MTITFNRTKFTEAIRHLSLIVENDPSFTNSASCIRVSPIDATHVELVGTDGMASLALNIEAVKVDDFSSPILLPLGMIYKVISHCTSDDVSFSSTNVADTYTMKAGNCKVKLRTSNIAEYPKVDFGTMGSMSISLPVKDIIDGFDKTAVAMFEGTNDRAELRGILLERKRGMNDVMFVATNGYQLSRYCCDSTGCCEDVEFRSTFPGKYVATVVKLLQDRCNEEDAMLHFLDGRICVVADGFTLSTTVVGKAFPDWERLIVDPGDYTVDRLEVDSKELLDTMERVNAVSDSGIGNFAFGFFKNEIYMSATNGNMIYHSTDTIPVKYEGDDVYFGCNPKFFVKVLRKVSGDTVKVSAGPVDGKSKEQFLPVTIDDGRYFNLILPLRGVPVHGHEEN